MARSSPTPIPRRPVLLAGVAAVALPALAGVLTGCAEQPPDPLIALLVQARSDAALTDVAAQALRSGQPTPATPAAGSSATPSAGSTKVDTLTALAAARRAHAEALAAELGDDAPPPPPADQPGPPAPEARNAVSAVSSALDAAQRQAAAAVPGLPRHRAALVGSIAACCAAYRGVLA